MCRKFIWAVQWKNITWKTFKFTEFLVSSQSLLVSGVALKQSLLLATVYKVILCHQNVHNIININTKVAKIHLLIKNISSIRACVTTHIYSLLRIMNTQLQASNLQSTVYSQHHRDAWLFTMLLSVFVRVKTSLTDLWNPSCAVIYSMVHS